MNEEMKTIMKWAAIGSRIFGGIVTIIGKVQQADSGEKTPEDAKAEIAEIDRQLATAIAQEREIFND
jgi:hypothetical protein